jgi:hypothetical protein
MTYKTTQKFYASILYCIGHFYLNIGIGGIPGFNYRILSFRII